MNKLVCVNRHLAVDCEKICTNQYYSSTYALEALVPIIFITAKIDPVDARNYLFINLIAFLPQWDLILDVQYTT